MMIGAPRAMVFADIGKLKREYTDKYVVVDGGRPELARFRGVVGQVRTVNMSGRALVEFLDYHVNIGWYDIDLDYLKVVDKPPPKPEKAEAKKPAKAEAKPAVAKAAPEAAKPAAAGKPSTADILAAARAGRAAAPAKGQESAPVAKESPAAPAKPPAAAAPAKVDRSKMSVAEMLAAARAQGSGGAAAKTQAEAAPVAASAPEPPAVEEVAQAAPAPAAKAVEKVDRTTMTIDQMITWCRQHDAK